MTEERRTAEQTIHDPTPLGPQCWRCEDTGKVAILRRAAPLFMAKMSGPMSVTKVNAKRMIAEFCKNDSSMWGVLLAPVIKNIDSTTCPNCVA